MFADLSDEELRHVAGARGRGLGACGEMGVLERSQRNATVVATSPMLLVTLTGWDVRRLRKTAPRAVDHLRDVVAERREHA